MDDFPENMRVILDDDAPHDEPESVRRDFDERIHVEQPATPLKFKSAAAFVREYVPLAYTIEPLLRSSSLYTLTAKTGAGKTGFLIVAALAVASGRADVLGRRRRATRGAE
jgi:hypothetical protein